MIKTSENKMNLNPQLSMYSIEWTVSMLVVNKIWKNTINSKWKAVIIYCLSIWWRWHPSLSWAYQIYQTKQITQNDQKDAQDAGVSGKLKKNEMNEMKLK